MWRQMSWCRRYLVLEPISGCAEVAANRYEGFELR